MIFAIIFFLSLLIFLFSVFALSRDDFVFTRKNISVEDMFNVSFLLILFIVLISRIFYIFFHFENRFLHPFVFLAIPYFPGLSIVGGVIGGTVFVPLVCWAKKISVVGRVLDIISLALFSAICFGIRPVVTIYAFSHPTPFFIEFFFSFLFILVFALLVKFFLKEKFKDGSIALLFLVSFSFLSLLLEGFKNISGFPMYLKGEGSIYLLLVIVCLILFVTREKVRLKLNTILKKK